MKNKLIIMMILVLTIKAQAQNTYPWPSTGDIGIGTTTPSQRLDVYGHINLSGKLYMSGYLMMYSSNGSFYSGRNAGLNGSGSSYNTAVGDLAFYNNYGGDYNVAIGMQALYENTTTSKNTAVGYWAMKANLGNENSAFGYSSLSGNTTGIQNTAIGFEAAKPSTTGNDNTAVGWKSMVVNGSGSGNTALGSQSGPAPWKFSLTNTTALGYNTKVTASNQIRIGNSSVTSIGGQVGWTTLSDGRFKEKVKEDVLGLEFINKLRPVSYTIDKEKLTSFLEVKNFGEDEVTNNNRIEESTPRRQTGFVAQEVEKIIKEISYDFSGIDVPNNSDNSTYGIRYSEFVVPLVKAVQELSEETDKLKIRLQEQNQLLSTLLIDQLTNDLANEQIGGWLLKNIPNPFGTSTDIHYYLPNNTTGARIMIYNLEGKQMKSVDLVDVGNGFITVNSDDINPGLYIYALIINGNLVDTKRMILSK